VLCGVLWCVVYVVGGFCGATPVPPPPPSLSVTTDTSVVVCGVIRVVSCVV